MHARTGTLTMLFLLAGVSLARGARVRSLDPLPSLAVLRWDGTDDRGKPASPGVYMYTVTVNGNPSTGMVFKTK